MARSARHLCVVASYRRDVFGNDSILDQFAAASALLVTVIVLGGFLAQAGPALQGATDSELRRPAAKGGLYGIGGGFLVVVLSALFDTLGR